MNNAIKVIATLALILAIVFGLYAYSPDERLTCELTSLSTYGFVQVSDNTEYVCVNKADRTDFIVIEDTEDEYAIGDVLRVTIDGVGDVVSVGVYGE